MEGGRGEAPGRCGPAATSIGGAVARRPRWRSGLASPRWSSAARMRIMRSMCCNELLGRYI